MMLTAASTSCALRSGAFISAISISCLRVTFATYPAWTWLLLLAGALPFVVVRYAIQKTARGRLPYAEPYFVALAVKLAAFAVTVPVLVHLTLRARQVARRPSSVEVRSVRPWRGPMPVVMLTTAATTITVAVTVLKYLHLLSEAARAAFG